MPLDGLTAGCYGGDSEGWFDPWALLQAFKLQVSKIEISFAAQVSFTHCKEIWIYVFPEKELRGLSPNFRIHVSVTDLYIYYRIRSTFFSCSRIGRPIRGIYKSLTET
jgi:hypothetical protein